MRAVTTVGKDLKAMFTKPMLAISFIAVAFVPILYSGFLIEASWDPYGQLEKIPVAVVNEDRGTVYEGEELHVGQDFVKELQDKRDFDWQFVTAEQAAKGIEGNQYYMAITIPRDFSQKASTLMDDKPQQAEIIFEPNGDYNFIAGQIGSSAMKDIRAELNASITEAYTRSMLSQVKEISDGFAEAGSGAGELKEGAGKLDEGAAALQKNLAKLADGTAKLSDGVAPLSQGALKLKDGSRSLAEGSGTLASGLQQLTQAGGQLASGAESADKGASQLVAGLGASAEASNKLQQGLEQASSGSAKLEAGLQQSAKGSSELADALKAAEAGGSDVSEGAAKLFAALEALLKANPELADSEQGKQLLAASRELAEGSSKLNVAQRQLTAGGQQLADSQRQLQTGAAELNAAGKQLLAGGTQLNAGQQQLLEGARQLQSGTGQLSGGMTQLSGKLAEAAAGGADLAGGAKTLNGGVSQLSGGIGQLAGGFGSLSDGALKLENGAGELKNGAAKLQQGSDELQGKLNDAASQTAEVKDGDDTVGMFAAPVTIKEDNSRKVENYGMGIAPYFISIALFVGGLFFTTVVSSRESFQPEATRFGRFLSRTFIYVLMSICQSAAAVLILLYGLKLDVGHAGHFVALIFAASLTFTLIVQALVTWGDQVGRYIAVLIMILQLTSSAGTFPKELLPEWMQAVHPWLPMSHSITGLKTAISGGDTAVVYQQLGYLSIYAAIALAATALYFTLKGRRIPNAAEPMQPAAELQA
ncbi:YhgE/Pip domain-containing protein [Paenibacillus pasadenensis]|uniref:YhgE/Pip domain-containing protein n=1 Tax=Paenibacillus pasadenensis TaxID=217090 RepID=UPI00203BBB7C|nr:YhgE/Pip domain-containing protein [Paenibacillus pasadenensis]MCM3748391.1 YhgE/Pip domain-containing protein [Paenibacillus pasadenensis]